MDRTTSWINSHDLSAADVPALFFVKALLYPFCVVATLALCALYWKEPFTGPYVILAVLSFLVAAQVLDVVRLYRTSPRFPLFRSAVDIGWRWVIILAFLAAVLYVAGMSWLLRDAVVVYWAALTPIALLAIQLLARMFLLLYFRYGCKQQTAVIVGVTDQGLLLARKIREDPFLGIRVVGFFEEREESRLIEGADVEISGGMKDLPDYIRKNGVSLVYITLPMARQPRILDLLDTLRDTTTSVYFVPDLFVFDLIQSHFDRLNGVPVVAVCESPFFGSRGILKRLSDIVIAGLMLLIIWPLLLIIVVGIKLNSPGPALFKQRRYGLDGEEIVVYKFRSMSVCEDGVYVEQAKRGDERITRFGRFLRRTSLDELPQIINVLQGRMSVVGPRPHAVVHNEMFRKLIKGYMIRHKVRPGITGLAQVNGMRGETDTLEKMQARINYDLEYLRSWSLGLDLWIILKTGLVVFGDQNAY
jgi:putative colanic acid biosynthesis UDP-glucose lipid carrier transferase